MLSTICGHFPSLLPNTKNVTKSHFFQQNTFDFGAWRIFSFNRRRRSGTSNITSETDSFDLILISSWAQRKISAIESPNEFYYSLFSLIDRTQSIFSIRRSSLLIVRFQNVCLGFFFPAFICVSSLNHKYAMNTLVPVMNSSLIEISLIERWWGKLEKEGDQWNIGTGTSNEPMCTMYTFRQSKVFEWSKFDWMSINLTDRLDGSDHPEIDQCFVNGTNHEMTQWNRSFDNCVLEKKAIWTLCKQWITRIHSHCLSFYANI